MTLAKIVPVRGIARLGTTAESVHPAPLVIDIEGSADRRVILLRGELDDSTAPRLREAVLDTVADFRGELILDIGGLSFIGSSGLNLFVQLQKRLTTQESTLVIARPTPSAHRILLITGLIDILTVHTDY